MEKKEIHLVYTIIGRDEGKARHQFMASYYAAECPYMVSSRNAEGELAVPLWFDSEEAARAYVETASSDTEREFYLIQEFSYHSKNIKDEAKIIFHVKSDSWPVLDEGKTERAPGVWANVRSFFVCDKAAAEGYVRRFDEDAAAASEVSRKGEEKQ